VRDVAQHAKPIFGSYGFGGGGRTLLAEALPQALSAHLASTDFTARLGMAFRSHLGTRYGDENLRIERVGYTPTKVALWQVATG
jgi:hypothetical protein